MLEWGTDTLRTSPAPSGISQLSVLKSQSLVLWVSFAGDLCVPPGSDLSDFVL